MSGAIEHFRFEVTPWVYSNGRDSEWRIDVAADGQRHNWSQIMPKVPFNKSELELFIREALHAFAKAGEDS